jgi:hypothetical protein
VYVNKNIVNAVTTPVTNVPLSSAALSARVIPNPATVTAMLEIEIPETGQADIHLIGMNGQQLGPVFSGMLPRGKHQLSLAGKIDHLPAGLYLIKIQARNKRGLSRFVIP